MYDVGNPPVSDKELGEFVLREFRKISAALNTSTDLIRLEETAVAPAKPRHGDIRLADGVTWNPGAGAGFYGYRSGAWRKLD
jgi:hypothetical protein